MSECKNPCQEIICKVPDDLRIYSLDGLPPEQLPPVPPPALPFKNQQVILLACATGSLAFTGTLPGWIQISGNSFVGQAGVFMGDTQNNANAAAQQALKNFVTEQSAAGNVSCEDICGDVTKVLSGLVWSVFHEVDSTLNYNFSDPANVILFNDNDSPSPNVIFDDVTADLCNPTDHDITVNFDTSGLVETNPGLWVFGWNNNVIPAHSVGTLFFTVAKLPQFPGQQGLSGVLAFSFAP